MSVKIQGLRVSSATLLIMLRTHSMLLKSPGRGRESYMEGLC